MTNQEKLKAVIAQAQSRGWMAGWEYSHHYDMNGEVRRYTFKQDRGSYGQKNVWTKSLSINDILFGTDFCEKFFPRRCELDNLNLCCSLLNQDEHKSMMCIMSESERIDFLYKHVEKEEEKLSECKYAGEEECGYPKGHYHQDTPDGDMVYMSTKDMKPQVKEIEKIEKIEKNDVAFEEYMRNKLNKIIHQVNANTKDIRDCKLNRN